MMDTLPQGQHNREIELKLELASDDADALLRHPLLAEARPLPEQSGHLHATYYDTADHALHRAGLTLRLRIRDGHRVQTIKKEGGVRGLVLDRSEWEWAVVGDGIDLKAAADTPLAPLVADETIRTRIAPAFTVETERQTFLIEWNDAVIEFALDRAHVSAGSRETSFCEVELELKKGNPSALFGLALDLAEAVPLRLSPFTKSERGYSLIRGTARQLMTADAIELPPQASSATAFQVIARACLSQIVRSEHVWRATQAAEALHQTRIGFRRLKVAVSLFRPILADRESRKIRNALRWAGKQLGPARDLDVLIDSVDKPRDIRVHATELRKAERKRTKAYRKLLRTLATPRFMQIILRTAAWVETGKWLTRGKQAADLRRRLIADHGVEELTRRWKPVRKLIKRMSKLEPDQRHALRIRIKRLRYGSEFLERTLLHDQADRAGRSWLTSLKRLQDILGELNDLSVGSTILPALAKSNPKRATRREKKLLAQAKATARTLRKSEPFWA